MCIRDRVHSASGKRLQHGRRRRRFTAVDGTEAADFVCPRRAGGSADLRARRGDRFDRHGNGTGDPVCHRTPVSYTHLDVYKRQEETNTYPIVVDKNNPNFIHAAYMLGGEEGDGLFDVFNKLENLEDIIKNAGYGRTLKPGDYFYYNKTLYRVVNQLNLSSWDKADSIIAGATLFNVSESGDYVKGKQYHSGEYVLLDQTWYTPKNVTSTTPPDQWHNCGTDPAKFEGVCKVDNNK